MSISQITFITACVHDPEADNNVEDKIREFRKLGETGILLCVYIDDKYKTLFLESTYDLPNVLVMWDLDVSIDVLEPIQLYRKYQDSDTPIILPDRRNMGKDTANYLGIQLSNVYFAKRVVDLNPWNTTHFAWVDFDLARVFRNLGKSQEKLRILSRRTLSPRFLSIPGCERWDKLTEETAVLRLLNDVYWRFCGGFFIGDAVSISEMHALYEKHLETFLTTHKKLVWEVNFWAWLEATTEWLPQWIKADHNDSIIHLSADFCSFSLTNHILQRLHYDYPPIESNEASNSAYYYYLGKHHLNTRYVNYWYNDAGYYVILHPNRHIITRNMHAILDDHLSPISFQEMVGPSKEEFFSKEDSIYGIEDIRLYELNGVLKFIATSRNHSPRSGNSMILGKYAFEEGKLIDCMVLEPPTETWCEKNWIPIVKHEQVDDSTFRDVEYFIYKWNPMQIGRLNDGKLVIEQEYPITSPYFDHVRGSSVFVDAGGGRLIGLVHFSEDFCPRHYFHILVTLDKTTFRPLQYSDHFCFNSIGIEFCIGFTIQNDRYCFWITNKDREPEMIQVSKTAIPLVHTFQFDSTMVTQR